MPPSSYYKVHAFATHLGAVSGQWSGVVHCTHVPSRQCGVVPEHAGLHVAGASGAAASIIVDDPPSGRWELASGSVDVALVDAHQPSAQR